MSTATLQAYIRMLLLLVTLEFKRKQHSLPSEPNTSDGILLDLFVKIDILE